MLASDTAGIVPDGGTHLEAAVTGLGEKWGLGAEYGLVGSVAALAASDGQVRVLALDKVTI